MPILSTSIEIATNGFRILSMVLSCAILIWWGPSVPRILLGRQVKDDTHRAGWVPLAHAGLALSLLFAIYVHGHRTGVLRLRRALMIHCAMLAVCIGASSVLR